MKLIFLDIDGCLNRQHFGKDEQSKFGFDDKCINALQYILLYVPDAKIVITSVWKKFDIEPRVSKTIPWREVLETKLNKPGVIIDSTSNLNGTYYNGKLLTRADEIRDYIKKFPTKLDEYVIIDCIDNEYLCYKGTELESHVVDCEISTGCGLNIANACLAVHILKGTISPKAEGSKPEDDVVPNICDQTVFDDYQTVFDDARNMATTLRKIDKELAFAARCEGDYDGEYSAEELLPNLCKIMYANLGNYKSEEYD